MPEAATAPAGAPSPAGAPGQPQQPNAPKPGETPAQAEARMLKRKTGNGEVEIPESEVWANYDKGRGSAQLLSKANERREEALKAKTYADGVLSRLKDKGNVREVLRDLGYTKEDLRAMSEAEIIEAINEEKMTPAERRAYEAEQKVKQYETEKQKAEREKQEAAHSEAVERHKDELANLFLSTMESTGLPKSAGRFVMHRMAHLYAQNEQAGLESSPEEMAAYVMEGFRAEHKGVVGNLKGEQLVEFLGPEAVKEVLRVHLEKARAKRGVPGAPRVAPEPKPAAPVDPRRGRVDFRALREGR